MKIKLQNAEKHLNEKLKNSKFKEAYELELAQKKAREAQEAQERAEKIQQL